MGRISTLQSFQVGNLPIKVLRPDLVELFPRLHPGFEDELYIEINYNKLHRDIEFDCDRKPIVAPAYITWDANDVGRIILNEAYCAFVWTLSHAVLTLFRERNSEMLKNLKAIRALNAFAYGLSLHDSWTDWDLNLPNPQEYDSDIDTNVGEANGLYLFAVCLILVHEFSHHQLGHNYSSPHDSIDDEFAADKAAVETFITAVKKIEPERVHFKLSPDIVSLGHD